MSYLRTVDQVLEEVQVERERQDAKWGEQNHDDGIWSLILGEEVGEAAQEALSDRFNPGNGHEVALREELIQVAAVTVAWIQAIDRRVASAEQALFRIEQEAGS